MPTTALPAAPYEALADVYDLLTDGYAHERWLGALERLARAHGLRGRRVLDVACGTGSSFLALLDAGYEVTACDLSPAMARRAAEKAAGRPDARVLWLVQWIKTNLLSGKAWNDRRLIIFTEWEDTRRWLERRLVPWKGKL